MAAYLYLNAALYALFALWCTLAPGPTAGAIGYTTLTAGGRSEYLVVYGGLELGLAIAFWMLARNPAWNRAGLVVAAALYAPIVAYRAVTLVRYWPVGPVTLGTAVLEIALLAAALVLLRSATPA